MIYDVYRYVSDRLALRGFPCTLQYGRTLTPLEFASDYIVFSRTYGASGAERLAPAAKATRNPQMLAVRHVPGTVRVFARSSLPGARELEHEACCDAIVDALIVAIYEWSSSQCAGPIEWVEQRLLDPSELGTGPLWPGAVFQLRFSVTRAVNVLTYEGSAIPEVEFTHLRPTSRVLVTRGSGEAEVVYGDVT